MIEEDQPQGYERADLEKLGKKWLDRLRDAEKREKHWIDDAEAAEKAFLHDDHSAGSGKVYHFNIFHSNIETIAPAIYNSTPIPDIRERFRSGRQTDPASYEAAQVIERAIEVQADDSRLDTEVEAAVISALVAGRGILRVRFDADEQESPGEPMVDEMTGEPVFDEEGQPILSEPQIILTNERVEFEVVSWRDYREGPAQRWKAVPWVAFRHCIPFEEVERIQDPEIKEAMSQGGSGEKLTDDGQADTHIWEVWCKETMQVYLIVDQTGEVLSISDDPMELSGFFPMPEPMQPITAPGRRTPVVPMKIYKVLLDEVEQMTRRIEAITDGLRVRGFVAGDAADIGELATAEDNTLIPIANLEGLAASGGLQNAISWWPVDQAINVLRELYQARETTKSMIYEVTGISDIVRGQGKASETATAQEIKSQWGSLRIRKLQKQVERHVRDVFVLCAEVIASKFSIETLQRIASMQISPEAAQILTQPLDHYRIDVETDSTIAADLTRKKGEMAEFLQGTASFYQTIQPIVDGNPLMAGPFSQIYAAFTRQLGLGKQAQDAVEDMAEISLQMAQQAQAKIEQQEQMQAQEQQMQQQMAQQAQQMEGERLQQGRDKLTLDERKAEAETLVKLAGGR